MPGQGGRNEEMGAQGVRVKPCLATQGPLALSWLE